MTEPILGLQGTADGSCIACYTPTDTGLGFDGSPEAHAAFLVVLGVPEAEAIATIEHWEPERRTVYRVCGSCAAKARLPKPALLIVGDAIPTVSSSKDDD